MGFDQLGFCVMEKRTGHAQREPTFFAEQQSQRREQHHKTHQIKQHKKHNVVDHKTQASVFKNKHSH